MPLLVDAAAREIAIRKWALPECLHVPVAAVNVEAIDSYIGDVERVLSPGAPPKALLVKIPGPPAIDPLLPICQHPNSFVLHARLQVWVHIAYTRYRHAYRKAFPEESIAGRIMSHCMNRRTAALKGFDYVRITPASRGANSSSAFSEGWGVARYREMKAKARIPTRPPFIQYGDLCDLMLLLDLHLGGGTMAAVNEGQQLVRYRTISS
jgi:hypothetical protein